MKRAASAIGFAVGLAVVLGFVSGAAAPAEAHCAAGKHRTRCGIHPYVYKEPSWYYREIGPGVPYDAYYPPMPATLFDLPPAGPLSPFGLTRSFDP